MLKIAIIASVVAVPFLFNAAEATAQHRHKTISGTGGAHGPSAGGAQGSPRQMSPRNMRS